MRSALKSDDLQAAAGCYALFIAVPHAAALTCNQYFSNLPQQLLHNFFKTTLTYCFCCFFQFNYVEVAAAPPVAALHKVGFFALHLWRQHIASCSSQMFFVLLRFKRNKVFLLLPRRKLATSISG